MQLFGTVEKVEWTTDAYKGGVVYKYALSFNDHQSQMTLFSHEPLNLGETYSFEITQAVEPKVYMRDGTTALRLRDTTMEIKHLVEGIQ
jgi:hypothetical protein